MIEKKVRAETPAASSTNGRGGKTREHILAAARQALLAEGYERITTRRIAQQAGVNIATLHYHFKTKEILLSEAVRFGLRRSSDRLEAAIANAPDATAALRHMFQTIWDMVRARPGIMRYDLAVRGFRDPDARREAAAMYEAYHQVMAAVFTRHVQAGGGFALGVTPETLTHYVVAAVDGVILQHTITNDDDAAHSSLRLIEQHVLLLLNTSDTKQDL